MADKVVCVQNVILPLAYPRQHSHRGMLKTQRQRQLHRPHLNTQSTSNNYGGKNTATRKHLVLSQPAQWHMVVVPPMAPSKYQLSVLLWHWPPCADIIFLPFGFFYLSFFSSPILSRRRLDIHHTWCDLCEFKMQVWNVLHAACWKYRMQKNAKNLPSGHHRTTLSGYIFVNKARIDNRKNLWNSNIFPTCPLQYGELRPTSGWDQFVSLGLPG